MLITLGFGAVGLLDDYIKVAKHRSGFKGLSKIIGQFGLAVGGRLCRPLPEIGTVPYPVAGLVDFGGWYIPFVVFIVVGTVNSVNLTDGLDGLAGGMGVFVRRVCHCRLYLSAIGFGRRAGALGHRDEQHGRFRRCDGGRLFGVFALMRTAKVFMGDTGSLALGAAIRCWPWPRG
ncbi:MAG: hypothetical protein ACLT0Y_07155 [Christensenellales bacterium]